MYAKKINQKFDKIYKISSKAQGTIEYLVIIAVVVVLSLVVVGLMINQTSSVSNVSSSASELGLKVSMGGLSLGSSVVGVDGNGLLVIKNSSGENLTLSKIIVDGVTHKYSTPIVAGDEKSFKLQDVVACESGAKSKSYSVKVEYVSASGLTKTSDFKTISIDCTEVVTAVKTPVEEKLFIRGSALSFQGSGSYITVGDGFGSFDDGFTPFTLSAWIKLNNPTMDYSNVIMAKQKNVFCRAPGYSFLVTNGKLNAMLWNYACEGKTIGVESVNSVVNNDEWTHVVMTYSGSGVASGVKFYANGQPVDLSITSDGLAGLSIASEANFSIGALGDGTDWFPLFKGAIDQPLVFNREISPNEVSLLYNGGDGLYADITIPPFNNGLIGGWHFDEGFGESVSDFTGNNNQGSITGSSSGYCGDYYEQAPCQAINGCSWSSYYDCYDSEWNWIGSYSESECYNNGGSYFYDYGYCEGTPIFEDPFVTGKVGHYEPA